MNLACHKRLLCNNWLMHTGYGKRRDGSAITRILHPIEDMLSDLPRVVVKDGAAALFLMVHLYSDQGRSNCRGFGSW